MARKKVVFLGSKPIGFRCFQHLIKEQDQLGIRCLGVLYNARADFATLPWEETAKKAGIPILQDLDQLPPTDLLYSVQYHQILKQTHIDKAALALNLHMAPLPEYRGANAFTMAIIEKKKEFGTTVHIMDEKTDHGDILFQKRFPIPADCWVEDLYTMTIEASFRLFTQTLPAILSGQYRRLPQEELIPVYGTSFHWRNEIHALKEIDLTWDADKIERQIRATSMPGFPPPFCRVAGKKIAFVPEKEL